MAALGDCVPVDAVDPAAVGDLADRVQPDLVVVGPDDPLVAGVVDAAAARAGTSRSARRGGGAPRRFEEVDEGRARERGRADGAYRAFGAGDEADAFAFLESLSPLRTS